MKRLLLLLILLAATTSHAQNSAQDLLVLSTQDGFWLTVNGETPTRFQQCPTTDEPIVSPVILSRNGDYLAYLTSPADFNQEDFDDIPPTNIHYCNGIDLVEHPVAVQPNDFSISGQVSYRARSVPVWSPDNRYLAWTELLVSSEGRGLALYYYDLTRQFSDVVPLTIPAQFGDLEPLPLVWATWGIAVYSETFNAPAGGSIPELLIFNPINQALTHVAIPLAGNEVVDFILVGEGGNIGLAVMYSDGTVNLGQAGTWSPLNGKLQLYAKDAPNGLRLNYTPHDDSDATWEVVDSNGVATALDYSAPYLARTITLSPDGQTLAYVTDRVYLWRNGQVQAVDFSEDVRSIVWTTLDWQIAQ